MCPDRKSKYFSRDNGYSQAAKRKIEKRATDVFNLHYSELTQSSEQPQRQKRKKPRVSLFFLFQGLFLIFLSPGGMLKKVTMKTRHLTQLSDI
jgi:hypothetical protein